MAKYQQGGGKSAKMAVLGPVMLILYFYFIYKRC